MTLSSSKIESNDKKKHVALAKPWKFWVVSPFVRQEAFPFFQQTYHSYAEGSPSSLSVVNQLLALIGTYAEALMEETPCFQGVVQDTAL